LRVFKAPVAKFKKLTVLKVLKVYNGPSFLDRWIR